MIRTEEEKRKMVEANKRMVDKVVKVIDNYGDNYWVGKVMEVVDYETFSIRRNKNSEPKSINMFNVRSM